MKINKVLKLALSGNKAKLSKYLNKGIFSKKDKKEAVKMIPLEGGGSSVSEDDILYYFSGTSSDSMFAINFTTKEIIASNNAEGEFEDNIAVLTLKNISSINGMSMLSSLPFTVERLDENITNGITKAQSTIAFQSGSDYIISNVLGTPHHSDIGKHADGVYLLFGGGYFKLTTSAGKEYLIKIITKDQ